MFIRRRNLRKATTLLSYVRSRSLVWSKDGKDLTRNYVFLDEKFGNRTDTNVRQLSNGTKKEINLTIAHISRRDNGVYTCTRVHVFLQMIMVTIRKASIINDHKNNDPFMSVFYPALHPTPAIYLNTRTLSG